MKTLVALGLILVACGGREETSPLSLLDPGTCFYCAEPNEQGACPVGIPWAPCTLEQAATAKCAGHAACGGRYGLLGDAGDVGEPPTPSRCAVCLEAYFQHCSGCECAELDAGTLITCDVCREDGGNVYDANYACTLGQ